MGRTRTNPYTVLYNLIFWSIVGVGIVLFALFAEICQRFG